MLTLEPSPYTLALKFVVFDHENSGWPRRRPETLDHPLQPLAIDRFSEVASGTKLSGAPALVQDGHHDHRNLSKLDILSKRGEH